MFKLDTFGLKVIATILMIVDHIAYIMIPTSEPIYWIMRMIGRISAPLFWFCFAEGYKHTSNRGKYAARLAVFALIMIVGNSILQIVADPALSIDLFTPNMFLTMFFMVIIIECIERSISFLKHEQTFVGSII